MYIQNADDSSYRTMYIQNADDSSYITMYIQNADDNSCRTLWRFCCLTCPQRATPVFLPPTGNAGPTFTRKNLKDEIIIKYSCGYTPIILLSCPTCSSHRHSIFIYSRQNHARYIQTTFPLTYNLQLTRFYTLQDKNKHHSVYFFKTFGKLYSNSWLYSDAWL